MQRSSLYSIVVIVALITGLYSCKKVNGIDNNTVVETPYTLYYADTAGTLYSTNDGTSHKLVFSSDGFPPRAICVSGNNILFAKNNLYVSINNGKNFNHAFDSLQWIIRASCNGVSFNLNQSMIIDMPEWNKVYTVTDIPHIPGVSENYLGVEYSNDHGVRGSFAGEGSYDTNGRCGLLPVAMYSYTRLTNGVLAGLAMNKYLSPVTGLVDTAHVRNFYKTCGDDNCPWIETTANKDFGASDFTGIPLPPTTTYPDTGFWTLGHYNNRLIAIDQTCHNGAFYSDDTGRTWKKYAGLPSNIPLLCISAPFEQICLIGTSGAGLYILNVNTQAWQLNNNGLGNSLIVRSIASKENIYKNKTKKRFIYLATNKGLYVSTDNGINWVLSKAGNFVAVY